jgi:uncharacterized protein (DUF58 family)
MLTPRGWWFLATVLLVLGIGMLGFPVLALTGLALFLWFVLQACLFHYRAAALLQNLRVVRVVRDEQRMLTSLWAGHSFQAEVQLQLRGLLDVPYLVAQDFVPLAAELIEGTPCTDGALRRGEALEISYALRAPVIGQVRFEGVRVLLADLQGFFTFTGFVRAPLVLPVLPGLVDADAKTAASKRYNLLLPPGIHRLSQPGSGSELLDLRDYIPGDPPKSIAWKVSARRDRLIIKEYESEVPVRCTLFVDTSASVRLGPPGRNALARLLEIASGTAQAAVGIRDLVGLCLFDEEKIHTVVRPARTQRHVITLLHTLAGAANLTPGADRVRTETLLPIAASFAEQVYPDLLRADVNAMPFWLPWLVPMTGQWVSSTEGIGRFFRNGLPFWLRWLVPIPDHWVPKTSWFGRLYRTLVLPLATVIYLGIGLALYALIGWGYRQMPRDFKEVAPPHDLLILAIVVLMGALLPLYRGFLRDSLPLFFSPSRRRQAKQRKQLAAILSVLYDLGPGGLEMLLQDDDAFGRNLQRFLTDHQAPFFVPPYDREGRYLFAAPGKVEVLATALLSSVSRGHDNELFVLLVDVLELDEQLGPLLSAVKVALSRHHQVVVVCPWPPGLPKPSAHGPAEEPLPVLDDPDEVLESLPVYLEALTTYRFQQAFHRLRQTFARFHVPVICAAAEESPRLILDRMDRLRGVGRRR